MRWDYMEPPDPNYVAPPVQVGPSSSPTSGVVWGCVFLIVWGFIICAGLFALLWLIL